MTVDFTAPRSTQRLIHENKPKFTPTKIPAPHHQLKHYLSTRCGEYLYYAANNEIYALHILSNKRFTVTILKWRPVCLDAAFGWICVGGQTKGQCAFIEIRTNTLDPTLPIYQHTEVDDLLPLDLNPDPRAILSQGRSTSQPAIRPPTYVPHEHEIGEDVVNSVVIHRLLGEKNGLGDDTVVILTNNDKSVAIFSLTQQEMLECPDEYPTAMNHASISPDGNLLLAVGDLPQVFFHRRVFKEIVQKGERTRTWVWQELSSPKLSLVPKVDGCFTTGFSPAGHVCAAAAQSGVVTLFNTALLREDMDADDAVIGIIRSSRLNVSSLRGAFRSMSFSPGPWDLLALAEDQGRVIIIDLRNALQAVQTIQLEPSAKHLETVEIRDQEIPRAQRELELERQLLQSNEEAMAARNHLAAIAHSADYLEYAADQRRRDRDMMNSQIEALRTEYRSDPHRLTENERSYMETVSGRRPNPNSANSVPAMSVNYPQGSNRFLPSMTPWDTTNEPARHSSSLVEYMRLRGSDRSRTSGERFYHPRRRSSVVVSQGNANTAGSSSASNTLAPITTRYSHLSASPSRLPTTSSNDQNSSSLDEPWQTISAAMASPNPDARSRLQPLAPPSALARDANRSNTPTEAERRMAQIATLRELESRNERQREMNQLNSERLRILRGQSRMIDADDESSSPTYWARVDPAEGVVTMGVGWSVDGRELFVATEEGIFQYKVNTVQRSQFPSMCWI